MSEEPEQFNIEKLEDEGYLSRLTHRLATRHPEDWQLAIVLGYLLGKATRK